MLFRSLLDEPFTGIDPVTIQSIQEIIRDLKSRGYSILITDHQYRETLDITDRSYIIEKGQVLCHGSPQEVINHPKARELYFGNGADVGIAAVPPPHTVRPNSPAATPPAKFASSGPRSVHEEETLTLDE